MTRVYLRYRSHLNNAGRGDKHAGNMEFAEIKIKKITSASVKSDASGKSFLSLFWENEEGSAKGNTFRVYPEYLKSESGTKYAFPEGIIAYPAKGSASTIIIDGAERGYDRDGNFTGMEGGVHRTINVDGTIIQIPELNFKFSFEVPKW